MTASKIASHRSFGSDLKQVAAHVIELDEYEELPELTEDMLARATVNRGGRARSTTIGSSILWRLRWQPLRTPAPTRLSSSCTAQKALSR